MDFLEIPKKVIDSGLLPYLKWNDLLRFRRVCKETKAVTDAYIQLNPDLAPEIEINEEDKNFAAFLKMNIPTTKLYLDNVSGDQFYERNAAPVATFIVQFGPLIKSLRIHVFSNFIYGKEWDFLESLVNLESFEADHYGYADYNVPLESEHEYLKELKGRAKKDPRYGRTNIPVPKLFENLKTLKMGQPEKFASSKILQSTQIVLQIGTKLEHVELPFHGGISGRSTWLAAPLRAPKHALGIMFTMISYRVKDKRNLKVYDFGGYHDLSLEEVAPMIWGGSPMFSELCRDCVKNGVKLANVSPLWFIMHELFSGQRESELGSVVVSMVGIHPAIFFLDMPNLERIEIRATSISGLGPYLERRVNWPELKSLDVTVDSKRSQLIILHADKFLLPEYVETQTIFKFFFGINEWRKLAELRLNFLEGWGEVAIPNVDDVVKSCPNIKKLSIVHWRGTNKALTKFWSGLPALEEVSLDTCRGLGNVAFVGEDARAPVFWKLKKLKKLSLEGLDQMPKIMDTLFSLVIRHLELTHFVLTSETPVQTITLSGIRSLLEGKFAESIEKFPFQDWSMAGVSSKQIKNVEKQFRSYNML